MSHIYPNRIEESISHSIESFKTLYSGKPACLCLEIQTLQLEVFRWKRKQKYIWTGSSGPICSEWQQRCHMKKLLLCSMVHIISCGEHEAVGAGG